MVSGEERIAAQSVARVEFTLSDDEYPFVEASTEDDVEVFLGEILPRSDRTYAEFFCLSGVDPEAFRELSLENGVDDASVLDRHEDGGIVELTVGMNCPAVFLAEHEALPRDVYGTDGEGRIVAEIPASTDAATVVDAFLTEYPSADLVAKHTEESVRPMAPQSAYRQAVADLTERQQAVLERADETGYYEWPRSITADELADDLGISAPTLHKHLRSAERKLIAAFIEAPSSGLDETARQSN